MESSTPGGHGAKVQEGMWRYSLPGLSILLRNIGENYFKKKIKINVNTIRSRRYTSCTYLGSKNKNSKILGNVGLRVGCIWPHVRPSAPQGCVSSEGWHSGHLIWERSGGLFSLPLTRATWRLVLLQLEMGQWRRKGPVHYLVESREVKFLHDSVYFWNQVQELGVPWGDLEPNKGPGGRQKWRRHGCEMHHLRT